MKGERNGRVIQAGNGSFVEMSECELSVESPEPPIAIRGCCGTIVNISLYSSVWNLHDFPSLFASEATTSCFLEEGTASVSESRFSSFCVSSDPFLSSSSISIFSLANLEFFNISISPSQQPSAHGFPSKSSTLMSCCSFSSVCDVYDDGIVPSLNNPSASLSASNISFVGSRRTRNVEFIGRESDKKHPGRQNETDNGMNIFTWCVWNDSRTTGENATLEDGASNGGAIFMNGLPSGMLSVECCSFNDCYAYGCGGGILCVSINSIKIENNSFNACTIQNINGGGICVFDITTCVRIGGCEFQNCKADSFGGGILLSTFQVSGSDCIGTENGKGESACVFECSFTACSLSSQYGGGLYCYCVPVAFKMRSLQFISCSAVSCGGGLDFEPHQSTAPSNNTYCYFLFFHNCRCTDSTPYGHDVFIYDGFNLFYSNNPFYESFTMNSDNRRVCYADSNWVYQHTEKKDWLSVGMKYRYVGVSGDDTNNLCGMIESASCKTVGHAVETSMVQLSSTITLLGGKHASEEKTISVGEKKISIVGRGKAVSVVGTSALSSTSTTLLSISSGQLEVGHLGIYHNAARSPSPSVFVVSLESGALSLEDVMISCTTGGSVISASVFEVALKQLKMADVEIKNMKINQPLFVEPSSGSSSGESVLGNVTIRNVNRTTGDGVVLAKSVKGGETFAVWNTTIEECECVNGNGGGIKVELESSTSKVLIGDSISNSGGTTSFNQCKCSGYGGGVMLWLADNSFNFTITSVSFVGCAATLGGKNLFVESQDLSDVINTTSIGFNPEIGINVADLNELCGRERNNLELIVPLVVFLRTFSSPAYVSGREQGSEFRLCGYEDFPCIGIGSVGEVQFPSSKRVIRLTSTFSFVEEVQLDEQSYEIDSSDETFGIKIEATGTKTQEALVMNSVLSTLTGILFELGGSIWEHTSFVHSSGGTLRFADCGIKMGSGVNSANYVFASASGGKIEIVGTRCGGSVGEVRFVGSVIVVNGSCECLMDEVIINQTTTNEVSGLVEIATSSSFTIQNCSITNCDLPSCGAIQVDKCSTTTLKNTSFENITRGKGDGGCVCVDSNEDGSKCTIRIENCSFISCEVNEKGKRGGGLSISLNNPSELFVSLTRFEKCSALSTSGSEGKGGGMMLSVADEDTKFELSGNLIFDQNKAEYGKNMFVSTTDLNESVTNNSFKFDYSSMIDDNNLFVGSDDFHQEKDLFMFLIPFSSFEIFISSEGFDVARCGSEEEPCFTMWKGMENMKEGNKMKTIQIERSTIIRDSFNMSNYLIKKSVKMGEEEVKAELNFEKAIGNQLEYFIENEIHLELTNVQLQLASVFDNSAKTIISNKKSELMITRCSFHSEAQVNNGFDCVFVDAIGGSVEVNDLSMGSCNVGNSIFVIHDSGVYYHFLNVQVESLNESGGCIISIMKSESGLKINEECVNIEIDNSSFSGVKRSDNGASILESKSEIKICLIMNESNITEDKAELSEKGGAIFFTLGASGSMKMIDSTISHCSCSGSTGKGGGVYLAAKERGDLNFTFTGMKFSANTAKVGNDIFVECFNITSQINESQFQFDLRENHYSRINAIYGKDECDYPIDTNLIEFVTIHLSDTIVVCSVNGSNDRQCGTNALPCDSIEHGLVHLTSELISQILVIEESVDGDEINLKEMSLSSKSREMCKVEVKSNIGKTKDSLISTTGAVSLLRVNFVFDLDFVSSHESLISPEGGILEIMNCLFTTKQSAEEGNSECATIPFHIINMEKGELQLDGCTISNLILHESALNLSSPLPSVIYSLTICNSTISRSFVEIIECGQLNMEKLHIENITVEGDEESLTFCLSMKKTMHLANCSICGVSSKITKGKLMKLENCLDVKMDSCVFDGSEKERNEQYLNSGEELCRWGGSVVDVVKSSVMMKDTTISNSPEGGITISGGNVIIEKGEFLDNNPFIEKYPSLHRNIICSDSGILNVLSLKGGDGLKDNSSLWILNEGCTLGGIASERDSSFFIPVLESVSSEEDEGEIKLTFTGSLLLPCNLSFELISKVGDVDVIDRYTFCSDEHVNESSAVGRIPSSVVKSAAEEAEVSVCILFGKADSPSSTQSFILKNRSEPKANGDERIVEGGKEGKLSWAFIIAIIFVVLFLIVLFVAIAFIVRWKKQKRRTKELEVIVEDTVKKDPKAFEMVTMEMSPEEQWRRAEREAEKKNEENMKKRAYDKTLGHSESSEHLLSESGSTEYILGKDSDKIPQWVLEKDEEEEIRKRTPSPSVSSTSTTDTSDTDTTFVRGEDLCPTTSSMSNLVDAMACSSPHEKLIVDLRDSLFMLLHGKNKTKEMEIGTLQEREMTAAQILFWVANGALHSFDEMENPLQSLDNLSSHIVLFSEHMVICLAMHSGYSSDDSDSSSTSSSSTIATSSSDISLMSERFTDSPPPSSAFEDELDNRDECLRWKAPELLNGQKKHATKKTIVFSIGMMLWECLTLQVPFGEYEAEVAGQKIMNGARPEIESIQNSKLANLVKSTLSSTVSDRPSLAFLKSEYIRLFPQNASRFTVSDAINLMVESNCSEYNNGSCSTKKASRTTNQTLFEQ
ncbi:uncharacterized protein MONOS_119 [Monocercomonoides exilis]|uniref:uncharacterized protein n=1 Tax=Monocercomonoides exilis TaxID=2049356 RepID=UPI0035597739|nr:hypothetical protein MONOS_119 [Monocercomonoides exilis]|eukprot:MONOS_119.1-p1 / transcript=MONOS_119.1 / gene=MONOS_119 / organism=Monocercomonoides_exilis_PA203 / gene_product=unspecified product / transcript_product=unspecified product / location=Mono_scaffold00002:194591-202315(-) / protein_length=2574 / sequence_SO=supercontig / SO=protein_coding / is_pseudo=false